MFDPKSDFALNKLDEDAIVCKSVTGIHTRITRTDFASEEEFLKWKKWYVSELYEEEKQNHVYADNNLSLEGLPESVAPSPSAEAVIERRLKKLAREQYNASTIEAIRGKLTPKQYRRLWLYCVKGLTEPQIAIAENVSQGRISESITAALKKIMRLDGIRQISDR